MMDQHPHDLIPDEMWVDDPNGISYEYETTFFDGTLWANVLGKQVAVRWTLGNPKRIDLHENPTPEEGGIIWTRLGYGLGFASLTVSSKETSEYPAGIRGQELNFKMRLNGKRYPE